MQISEDAHIGDVWAGPLIGTERAQKDFFWGEFSASKDWLSKGRMEEIFEFRENESITIREKGSGGMDTLIDRIYLFP